MNDKKYVDHKQNNSANSSKCNTDSAVPRYEFEREGFFFLKVRLGLKITKLSKG